MIIPEEEFEANLRTNIYPGQVVFNFPTLCNLLGVPKINKTSNSGKALLKQFSRYCDYKTSGTKYVILDVYDEPLPVDSKIKRGNHSIYISFIEAILLCYLSQTENSTAYFTQRRLIEILGMANPDYKNITVQDLNAEYFDIRQWELDDFNKRSWLKISSILDTALKNLENRSLISVIPEYIIVDENGRHFKADDLEIKNVLYEENRILTRDGYYNKAIVALRGKNKDFYNEVNHNLNNKYGWKYYYKQKKILMLPNDALERGMEQNLLQVQKLMLNEKVIAAIDRDAEAKALRIDKDFKYPQYYVEHQKQLSQRLINIDKKQVEKTKEEIEEEERLNQELDALFG